MIRQTNTLSVQQNINLRLLLQTWICSSQPSVDHDISKFAGMWGLWDRTGTI